MIKAPELRIGNLIKGPNGDIIIVTSIANGVINESYEGPVDEDGELYRIKSGFSIKEITPIPLTPDWMAKCGFKEEQRGRLGGSWEISIMPSAKRVLGVCNMTSRTLVSFVAEPGNIVMLRPIYDIHQLQNLYFALTVEELEIKL